MSVSSNVELTDIQFGQSSMGAASLRASTAGERSEPKMISYV